MMTILAVWIGKIVATLSRLFNIGAGETWPGEIALNLDKDYVKKGSRRIKKGIILVAGTNGKTTTAKMVKTILEIPDSKFQIPNVIYNQSGANLLNGIASALIKMADFLGEIKADWGVFEVDENTLPLVLKEFTPKIVVCLNLFRDQLDRYGEIDLIAEKWHQALLFLPRSSTVVLNADDPQIAYLGKNLKAKVLYFGLEDGRLFLSKIPHAADSIHCLSCGEKLEFKGVYFSHLGIWECKGCGEKRSKVTLSSWDWPLDGVYNRYNALAAVLVAKSLGIKKKKIQSAFKKMTPAFGRGEEFTVRGKKIKLLLSKNPTGFNVSLRRLIEARVNTVLLALNDRIPDGRDVSWIWDVDFEELAPKVKKIICTGDRACDLGLRIKYAGLSIDDKQLTINKNLKEVINYALRKSPKGEALYILPTYSAMLEIRKILKGRSIL